MASTIITRNPGDGDDKRIQLSNSQFARVISIGSTWNKIRIATRITATDLGSGPVGTPRLAFGICSGTSNIYGDATVTNWCGLLTSAATWNRQTFPFLSYTQAASGLVAKKVGSTLTTGAILVNPMIPIVGANKRAFLILDITKGSPNYTFQGFAWDGGTNIPDVSLSHFLASIEGSNLPVDAGYNTSAATAFAVDESAGVFNAVNVHWDKTSFQIELSDIAVVRLA